MIRSRALAIFLALLLPAQAYAGDKTPLANYSGIPQPLQAGDAVPAAHGGTSATTLTAHCVIIGEGTSAVHFACPVSSTDVLTDNGPGMDPTFQAATGAGGTVTSVGLTAPSIFTVSGSPVTTSGSLAFSLNTQAANLIFAGPSSGSAATPTYRSMVSADILSSAALAGNPTTTTQTACDNSTRIATTAYTTTAVANALAAVNPATSVNAATTTAANTSGLTYNNGASGIGATFTGAINTPLMVDGFTYSAVGQRLLVKNDTQSPSGAFNGVYSFTQLQTTLLPPILTRATDYNQPSDINSSGAIPVISGTVNALTSWLLTSSVTTVGTDPLTYTQFTFTAPAFANPTATASDVAVNGSASTIMRSDAAPAIQKTSSSMFGVAKVDGTSIGATGGTISLIGPVSVALGGTNATSAGGAAVDNISGFSGTGFLTRTGSATYAFQSATNGVTLGNLAQVGGNSYLGNTGTTTGNVTAYVIPDCHGTATALQYTQAGAAGMTCGTITAATGGSNPFFIGTPAIQTGIGAPSASSLPVGSLYLRNDTAEMYQQYIASGQVPTLVQAASAVFTNSVTVASTPASGDMLVAVCSGITTHGAVNTAGGWTDPSVGVAQTGLALGVSVGYKFAVTGESTTQTPCSGTSGTSQWAVAIYEVSGVPNWTASFEAIQLNTSNPATYTTLNANDLVLGDFFSARSSGADPGAGTVTGLSGGFSTTHGSSSGFGLGNTTSGQSFASSASSVSATYSYPAGSLSAMLLVLKPGTAGWQRIGNIISLKSGGTVVTTRPISINFGTNLAATDDGLGNTTVTGNAGTVTNTSGTLTSGQLLVGNGTADIKVANLSGDCTTSGSTAITCTKTSGTGFGTFATQNYATPPAIGGTTPAAGAFSSLQDTGITGSSQCVQADSAGNFAGTGSACGAGGGGGGTVTSVTCNAGLAGGAITTSGTCKIDVSSAPKGAFMRSAGTSSTPVWSGQNLLTILQRTTAQSIPNGSFTTVSWDTTVVQDDVSAFSAGSPTIVTVPTGITKVRITFTSNWATNSTGLRYTDFQKNGANIAACTVLAVSVATDAPGKCTTRWLTVAAADTLSEQVIQTSGGSLNFSPTGGTYNEFASVQFEWAP